MVCSSNDSSQHSNKLGPLLKFKTNLLLVMLGPFVEKIQEAHVSVLVERSCF